MGDLTVGGLRVYDLVVHDLVVCDIKACDLRVWCWSPTSHLSLFPHLYAPPFRCLLLPSPAHLSTSSCLQTLLSCLHVSFPPLFPSTICLPISLSHISLPPSHTPFVCPLSPSFPPSHPPMSLPFSLPPTPAACLKIKQEMKEQSSQ